MPPRHRLHDDYLNGLERATNLCCWWMFFWGTVVALSNSAKTIPCTLHALSLCSANAQPKPSLCSANAQPMLSQSPAYAQPMLSQCSAKAQPMLSQSTQPMLSQCPAYAQLPKMPIQCLAKASASPANA